VDTGSSWLWVSSFTNNTTNQANGHYFNCSTSATCNPTSSIQSVLYGNGYFVQGNVVYDIVNLETAFTVNNHSILTVNNNSSMNKFQGDGIIGLGFGDLSQLNNNLSTIMDNMKDQGLIKQRAFSLYMSDVAQSVLVIGGYNLTYIKNENENFTMFEVVSNREWKIGLTSISYANTTFADNETGILIDSGTAGIVASDISWGEFVEAVMSYDSSCVELQQGAYSLIQCDCPEGSENYPEIVVRLGGVESGRDFIIESELYVVERSGVCVFKVIGVEGQESWVLGELFLKQYYSLFDIDGMQIGFVDNSE